MNPELAPVLVAGIIIGAASVVTGYVLTVIVTGWLRDRRRRQHLDINRIVHRP